MKFKRIFFLISFLLFSVLFFTNIFADDRFTIDYPPIIGKNQVFEITLHIDPSIGQYVNYIEFPGNIKIYDNDLISTDFGEANKIHYNGAPVVKLKVYFSGSSFGDNLIRLSRIGPKKEIRDALKGANEINSYMPKEEGWSYGFMYPSDYNGDNTNPIEEVPIAELIFDQLVLQKKVNIIMPDDSRVNRDEYNEKYGNRFIDSGSQVYYSNPGGFEGGDPPYYSLGLVRKTYDYNDTLESREIPTSYDGFKEIVNKETSGKSYRGDEIIDLPSSILNKFNADFGFYTYDIDAYHANDAKDPNEMFYSLNLAAFVFPRDTITYYEFTLWHEDITSSYSESEIIDDDLDLFATTTFDFPEHDSFEKNFISVVNDDALKYLSGSEFEVEEEEEVEQKNISSKEFEISFSGPDEETIWNRGRFNVEDDDAFNVLIKIDGKAFDEEGKEIGNVDDDELFADVKLISEIVGKNESQIGLFGLLSKNDSRHIYSDLETIDVRGKGPRLYKSFYRPKEVIKFHLEWKGAVISNYLTFNVNVKDASPNIKLKKPNIEVQDGDHRGIQFEIEDADKSKLKCSMMVPSDFAIQNKLPYPVLEYDGKKTTFAKFDCKDGDKITFKFNAPKFGNFNLNSEINALSMWKMQQDTMVGLATDLIGFGVEKRLKKLEQSESLNRIIGELGDDKELIENGKQLKSAMDTLGKANDISTNTQNVIKVTQVAKNAEGLEKDYDKASNSHKKGWLEWGADVGIFGINVAQSTVGAIAMLPGKVPILGPLGKKMGGAFSLTFNLMTNVWKGNFEYLSKVEKINRAQEMTFPYPVIITVEDEDGFETKAIQNVMVVFNWLE